MPTNVWPYTDTFSDGTAEGLTSFGTDFNSTIGFELSNDDIRRGNYCVYERTGPSPLFSFSRVMLSTLEPLGANPASARGVLHRRPYSGDVKVEATFALHSLTGTAASSHFRRAGVCARIQGGTLQNDATVNVTHEDASFYWARLEETAVWPATTYKLQILRV